MHAISSYTSFHSKLTYTWIFITTLMCMCMYIYISCVIILRILLCPYIWMGNFFPFTCYMMFVLCIFFEETIATSLTITKSVVKTFVSSRLKSTIHRVDLYLELSTTAATSSYHVIFVDRTELLKFNRNSVPISKTYVYK